MNVSLPSNTRATVDGPRKFEPRLNNEYDNCTDTPFSKLLHDATLKTLNHNRFKVHPPLNKVGHQRQQVLAFRSQNFKCLLNSNFPTKNYKFIFISCRPSGIVVSDADCCAAGPGFESWRKYGCLQMNSSAFAAWGNSKGPSSRKSCREVGGRGETMEGPCPLQTVLPQNWGGTESNRTLTCMVLRLRITTGVHLASCHDECRGSGSDAVEIK
ncbi:hypothetical protein TNCV_707331 [Trichonephila clavipes]|nr:hypothetical protein TNCV_707331 [Trichonephila clavipes]